MLLRLATGDTCCFLSLTLSPPFRIFLSYLFLSISPFLPLSLSLPLSFFLARQFVRFSPSLFLFSLPVFFLFLFLFFIFLFRSWSPTLLFPVLLSGSQVKRPWKNGGERRRRMENGGMEGPGHRRRVINAVVRPGARP